MRPAAAGLLPVHYPRGYNPAAGRPARSVDFHACWARESASACHPPNAEGVSA
jgi:hypothetical protein